MKKILIFLSLVLFVNYLTAQTTTQEIYSEPKIIKNPRVADKCNEIRIDSTIDSKTNRWKYRMRYFYPTGEIKTHYRSSCQYNCSARKYGNVKTN